ncbi:hypothetical protein [Kibdelosporangium aridum]|uniref:Uncharacterized protein n=1 Tax=Kibdelosporangium aridum TaxID=2030 RepID=A0A1W2FLX3_KIBAR|nr:hypothetical protein [Kibdelosporangium aridum]SMD22977.1 hypothetical protein SAMN05661093_07758 [Kibdelosporangium aridum]
MQFLGKPTLRDDFERRGIHLDIEHVRTRDLWSKLDGKKVDMVRGSFAAEPGNPPTVDYDFLERHRERVALLKQPHRYTGADTKSVTELDKARPTAPNYNPRTIALR